MFVPGTGEKSCLVVFIPAEVGVKERGSGLHRLSRVQNRWELFELDPDPIQGLHGRVLIDGGHAPPTALAGVAHAIHGIDRLIRQHHAPP